MKKNFAILLMAIFSLTISSCSKDDDSSVTVSKDSIFKGTKWQTDDFAARIVYGGTCYEVIHFMDNTNFEIYCTRNSVIKSYDHQGTYTYDENSKIVTIKHSDCSKSESFNLKNSGTLKRTPSTGSGYYNEYVKQ